MGRRLKQHTFPWSTCPIVPAKLSLELPKQLFRSNTNIHMKLLPLKHCGHPPEAIAILGKDLLDRVYASSLAEGKFAGAEKRSKRACKGRHPG